MINLHGKVFYGVCSDHHEKQEEISKPGLSSSMPEEATLANRKPTFQFPS